jgi:serralysin
VCYGCFLAGGDSTTLGMSHALGESSLRTIPPDQLISPDFRDFSQQQVVTDGVLDLYLHRPAGPVVVNGGGYGSQTIQTLAMEEAFYSFLTAAIERLDAELNLNFRLVQDPSLADVRFFLDSEISLGDSGGVTLGIALSNDTPERDFWEVMLNMTAFNGEIDYLYYAALHELGHTLGLEHPFDRSDGDVFASANSSRSAYPEETLMAYRSPWGDQWPTWFSSNDLAALKAIWGEATDAGTQPQLLPQKLIGSAIDDTLIGGGGPDLLRGEQGNDVLTGGGSADELWGGPGSNQFFSAADGATDWLLISRDGSSKTRRYRRSVDEIADLGSEDQVGILGAGTRRLRFSATSIASNTYGPLDGIGIYVGQRLEVIYTGGDLTRAELQNLTVGLPAGYTGNLG